MAENVHFDLHKEKNGYIVNENIAGPASRWFQQY